MNIAADLKPRCAAVALLIRSALLSLIALAVVAAGERSAGARQMSVVADRVLKLTRDSQWKLLATVRIAFRTFHPQGMVKIGARFFVSAVEVKDRAAGIGAGHLFSIDSAGQLLGDLVLGEGSIYHPGGIDYDGNSIWVPVAEYRPDSRSIVYRVDPGTGKATEVLRFAAHIGG